MKLLFKKQFCAAFTVTALLSVAVYGAQISDLKKEQKDVRVGADRAAGLLRQVKAEKDTVLAEIDTLDTQLTVVTDDLNFVGEQLVLTEDLLVLTGRELEDATQKRESQYDAYKKRARYMYINGTASYLDVVLKADSVVDFLNRVEYVNRIVESDKEMAAKLTASENLVNEKLDGISKTKRELDLLSSEYEVKFNELEETKLKKLSLVERLNIDEEMYRQQIEDLEEDSKRIEQLIKDAEAAEAKRIAEEKARAAAVYKGGKIGWPVPSSGNITSGYGDRINPINGKPEFHKGIDIAAAYGADIVAAEGGTVISSGWNGGYGNTVVINHGNGLSTLYAHNSSLVLSQGDTVKKGQVVAKAGSTGYSTGNHLHFEVRVNGAAVNPMPYVKG